MFDIVVVANRKRPPIVIHSLRGTPHKLSWTIDAPLIPRFVLRPEYKREVGEIAHLGPFRCYKGHQDALKKTGADHVMVFEDDAVPNRTDWLQLTRKCEVLLNDWEVVSLHGRDVLVESTFEHEGMQFAVPGKRAEDHTLRWSLGSLAYLIRRDAIQKIIVSQYEGLPMDLYLATNFKFCVLPSPGQSPFNHDRRYGSLVEDPR